MPNKPLSVDQALQKARRHAKNGEAGLAAQLYRSVLQKFPKNQRAIAGLNALQAAPAAKVGSAATLQQQIGGLTALYRQGKLKEVLARGEALARQYPNASVLHNILGSANAGMGRLDRAVESFVKALKIKPDFAEAHNNLGIALKDLGKPEEAIASYSKALQIEPGHFQAHNNLGIALKALGKHEEAIASFSRAVQIRPGFVPALNKLANSLSVLGKHKEAVAIYARVAQIRPDDAEAHNNLGLALKNFGDVEAAMTSFYRALRIKPDLAEAHCNLGTALNDAGKPEEAIASCARAVRIRPGIAEAHNIMGNAFKTLGRRDQAIASYNEALRIKPGFSHAHWNLGHISKCRPDDPRIARMREQIANPSNTIKDKILLNFALGNAFDDIGDAERAFGHFQEGNRLRKQELGYQIAADRERIGLTKSIFGAADLPTLEPTRPVAGDGKRPVFIVGMMRSGTTLAEQILASHSQVFGAGELEVMNRLAERFFAGTGNDHAGRLTVAALEAVRGGYLGEVGKLGDDTPYVTDKMPLNFIHAGFILTALPEAKLINLQRDPVATCWSIFRHYFSSPGNGHAYDLMDVAEFYKLYVDLMNFWRERFPNRIFDLDYEALTKDQEPETRKLIDYCGLEWEDRCLEFHTTDRAVRTASAAQVRRKMYTGSSQAWRKYEAYLQPLVRALNG